MKKLRVLRELKGMTQTELSVSANVSQSLISDIENGRVSPTVRILKNLAKALGVSVADLLDEEQQSA